MVQEHFWYAHIFYTSGVLTIYGLHARCVKNSTGANLGTLLAYKAIVSRPTTRCTLAESADNTHAVRKIQYFSFFRNSIAPVLTTCGSVTHMILVIWHGHTSIYGVKNAAFIHLQPCDRRQIHDVYDVRLIDIYAVLGVSCS